MKTLRLPLLLLSPLVSIIFLMAGKLSYAETGVEALKPGLRLYKTRYLLKENIWVKTWMENHGNQDCRVVYSSDGHMVVIDANGKRCFYLYREIPEGNISIPAKSYFNPSTFNLNHFYGSEEIRSMHSQYLPLGEYTVYAVQFIRISDAKKLAMASDTFRFSIVEPQGDEAKALLLLNKGDFRGLLKTYPQSAYAPTAFRHLITQINIGGSIEGGAKVVKAQKQIEEMVQSYIKDHPNDPVSVNLLWELDGSEDLLRKVSVQYAGTLVGERATERLQEKKDNKFAFPLGGEKK